MRLTKNNAFHNRPPQTTPTTHFTLCTLVKSFSHSHTVKNNNKTKQNYNHSNVRSHVFVNN